MAAFTLPEFVNYLLAGSMGSITLVSLLARYAAEGREDEADDAFSVILTLVAVSGTCLIVVAMLVAEPIVRAVCPGFTPQQIELCLRLTRILLPIQALFMVGALVSATLQWRHRFLFPALAPVIYNLGTIVGGLLLSRWFGISSLAYGALTGALLGSLLLNVIGARNAGVRFRLSFNVGNPGFLEWLRLTIPLMVGVSLTFFDEPFMRYFASGGTGDITRLSYAKRMFAVPGVIIGQAAGQAFVPRFAKLFSEGRLEEFGETVNGAVYRAGSLGLLVGSWLVCAALPCVDLVFRLVRGRFLFSDSQHTATLLVCFAFALVFWSVQGFYARSFYATGNTVTPMVVGTVVTVGSFPLYGLLHRELGIIGLPIASGLGMMCYTIALALLLSRRSLVPLLAINRVEIGKALLAAVVAGLVGNAFATTIVLDGTRAADLKCLGVTTLAWATSALAMLVLTKSKLLNEAKRTIRALR